MELEISPAPSETERAAIIAALEEVEAETGAHTARGAWWQAGVRENLDDDPDS